MNIYPSILEETPKELFSYLNSVLPLFNHFQIDIADGQFVDTKTTTLKEIGLYMKDIDFTAPEHTFEFHLMVKDIKTHLDGFKKINTHMQIERILVHYQPLKLQKLNYMKLIETHPYQFGLVLNPEVSIDESWKTLLDFPIIQLMTVQPGGQGRPFMSHVLNKIDELREKGYEGEIILDGAMNNESLATVLERKNLPDTICPGSYLKADPKAHLETLENLIKKAG